MIEAIVAAALLVVVALGVLGGLDTAQRSSGREKARSVAAALTEQDQERLRSFRAVDLANYDETREIRSRSTRSSTRSRRASTGSATRPAARELQQQRDAGGLHADHVDHRVAADQHADPADEDVEPRRAARSARSAPTRARSASRSTTPPARASRACRSTITGPSTLTNSTNSAGCAIFAYVPIGNYTASVDSAGWVDKGGNQKSSVGATVSQRHGQRQDDQLRRGGQRRRQVRHREARQLDRQHRRLDPALGRQRRRALGAVLAVRRPARLQARRPPRT